MGTEEEKQCHEESVTREHKGSKHPPKNQMFCDWLLCEVMRFEMSVEIKDYIIVNLMGAGRLLKFIKTFSIFFVLLRCISPVLVASPPAAVNHHPLGAPTTTTVE